MSIVEEHTSYFDIPRDELFEDMDIRTKDCPPDKNEIKAIDLIRKRYRNDMVNRIMAMSYETFEPLDEYEVGLLEFRQLLVSAFNTSLIKIMTDDMDTFVVYLNRRAPYVDEMNDMTLGDVMLIMAERLTKKKGGSIKFWLGYMFIRMGCTGKRVDFGQIFLNMITYNHYSDCGYGLFGDKTKLITHPKVGFNEQYLRFLKKIEEV